jgi:hypothetical protein
MMKTEMLNDELLEDLDLLADGELPEAQRAELFVRLDEAENGWRLCAQALLESRMISESLRPATAERPPIRSFPGRQVAGWLGIAAALALAFVTGYTNPQMTSVVELPVVDSHPHPARPSQSLGSARTASAVYTWVDMAAAAGLEPGVNELGQVHYTTREELSPVYVTALRNAGLSVERRTRMMNLTSDSGAAVQLPFTETRVMSSGPY